MDPLLSTDEDVVDLGGQVRFSSAEAMSQWIFMENTVATNGSVGVYEWSHALGQLVMVEDHLKASNAAKRLMALDPSTPPEVLSSLLLKEKGFITIDLCNNRSTPEEALMKLVQRKKWNEPLMVVMAQMHHMPPAVLMHILSRTDDLRVVVPKELAMNRNLPVEGLKRLAMHPSDRVRKAVVSNPNATPDVVALVESYKKK